MSTQIRMRKGKLRVASLAGWLLICCPLPLLAQSTNYIDETQSRRAAERFDIISFIRANQAAVAAQNARYGRYGGGHHGPYPDFKLTYSQDWDPVSRNSNGTTAPVGSDTRMVGRAQFLLDDIFTTGNRRRLMNIDLGFEGYYGSTARFAPDGSYTGSAAHSYTESGGALLIRPLGRSSQDTGFLVKAGYLNFLESGLWSGSTTSYDLYAPYLGAEARLYLMPFLGLRAEYQYGLETDIGAIAGKFQMSRFTYGAFVEIYLLELGAYIQTAEFNLTDNASGNLTSETYTATGLSASLFF